MDEGYSILMALVAVAILKDYKMLPYRARVSVQPKDEKRYILQLSKVVAIVIGVITPVALLTAVMFATSVYRLGAPVLVICVVVGLAIIIVGRAHNRTSVKTGAKRPADLD